VKSVYIRRVEFSYTAGIDKDRTTVFVQKFQQNVIRGFYFVKYSSFMEINNWITDVQEGASRKSMDAPDVGHNSMLGTKYSIHKKRM